MATLWLQEPVVYDSESWGDNFIVVRYAEFEFVEASGEEFLAFVVLSACSRVYGKIVWNGESVFVVLSRIDSLFVL